MCLQYQWTIEVTLSPSIWQLSKFYSMLVASRILPFHCRTVIRKFRGVSDVFTNKKYVVVSVKFTISLNELRNILNLTTIFDTCQRVRVLCQKTIVIMLIRSESLSNKWRKKWSGSTKWLNYFLLKNNINLYKQDIILQSLKFCHHLI